MLDISVFLQEYDAAVEDVNRANHRSYAQNLQRWLYVIDRENPLGSVVADIENGLDAKRWFDEAVAAPSSGMGGSQLSWPLDSRKKMGHQLFLCRLCSENDSNPFQIGARFFRRSHENMDGIISNINREVFSPLSRDLRRHFLRIANDRQEEIPASDRTVTLQHNAQSYQEAVEALDRLEELVQQTNDYDDHDDKEQKLAELAAGRTLLKAIRVRVRAIGQVLASPIKSLVTRFGTGLINQAAHDLWGKLTTLLGSGWHWPF